MLNELIQFYYKNLTLTSLIKKYFSFYFYLVIIIYLILGAGIIYLFIIKDNLWWFSLIVPLLVALMYVMKLLSYYTLLKVFPECTKNKSYDFKKLNIYFFEELEKYLKSQHLIEMEDNIISLLKEKSQSLKIPFIFISGTFSVLSLSVFNSLCQKLYDISEKNLKEILLTTILLFMIIALVIPILYYVRDFYFSYYTQYTKINNLINMLEEHKLKRNIESVKNKNYPIIN